jgi:serine/threonine protein kinase
MAPTSGSSHNFQKLKLDTSASHRPVKSTFASLSRQEPHHNGTTSTQPEGLEIDTNAAARLPYPNRVGLWQNTAQANGHLISREGASPVSGSDGEEDIETKFRNRTKSISFNKHVTLDSGNRKALEEPLPKSSSPSSFTDVFDGDDSDHDYVLVFDQRKRPQHHTKESRYPLLDSTVDELTAEQESEERDRIASLTSDNTISPVLEEVQTPLDPPNGYLVSPHSTASSIESPSYFGRRGLPLRTHSTQSHMEGDGKQSSRRSSARSRRSLSSMSPAASFLAGFHASKPSLKPTEPDDEGQGIGYNGEYVIGKQIGYGGYSVIKELTSFEEGVRVTRAVKIVRKQLKRMSELDNEQIQTQFEREVEIWRYLRHRHILPLMKVYTTEFATFCIMGLNKGGTLFDLVRARRRAKQGGIDLSHAKRYTYQLASALRYLHNDMMIVHRDVKLENCLLDMTAPDAERDGGNILLCDFGMAEYFVSDQRDGPEPHASGGNQNIGPADTSAEVTGSLKYAAPELFKATAPIFSPTTDMWAFGVVVYALLTAHLPFDEGLDARTIIKIENGEYDLDLLRNANAFQDSSADEAVALIQGCMNLDVEKRWTIAQVLKCAWLEGCEAAYGDDTSNGLFKPK